jgi:hypothetical protein
VLVSSSFHLPDETARHDREVVYQGTTVPVRFSGACSFGAATGIRLPKIKVAGAFPLDIWGEVRKIGKYLFIIVNKYAL